MLPFLLFVITTSQKQLADNPIILDAATDIYASEFVFISTPHGMYTFDRNTQIWGKITELHGLPDNAVTIAGLDDGILWVASQSGCASADVRLNDWQTYDLGGKTEALVFDNDYVWAAGEYGIARFEKFAETWEDIASFPVNHGYADEEYIWFATDSGVVRYDRQFEKIESLPEAPPLAFYYIINTPERLWFLAQDTFVAYEKTQERWSRYAGFAVQDYSVLGDSVFAVCAGTVYVYQPQSDAWQVFRDVEVAAGVNGVFAGTENMLFATDNGLLIYNWEKRTRTIYNRSSGLEYDSLIDAYEDANHIFVVSTHAIEFFDKDAELWQTEEVKPSEPKKPAVFYIDEAGGHARFIKNVDLRLQGWAYYIQSRTISGDVETITDNENINLRLIGLHTSKRFMSLYYDDTDKDQELYGFSYQGLQPDLLYYANGGYLNSQYFEFDLIPTYSILGAQTRLKRAPHALDLQAGEMKSEIRNDFFTGKSNSKEVTLVDRDYQKNSLYRIYDIPHEIIRQFDTLFIDDLDASNNGIDTRTGFTIAGITGDFDLLINGQDYFIDYNQAMLHILTTRNDSDVIVLLLNDEEIVIQSPSVQDRALENVYVLGPDIEPHSFTMSITDTLGTVYALSDFGLDQNEDNRVDDEFINYDLGYLVFPSPRPFPDEVYDTGLHIYTMDFTFTTRSLFYYLTHYPVLRNSEIVSVDAEIVSRGNDYILDYTSGTLLFLREDIISDFSEIEVQYASVDRDRTDRLYSVEPNVSIGKTINVTPGISRIEELNIYHLSGRWRATPYEQTAFKIVPQAAVTQDQEWAHDYQLIATHKRFSLNAGYSGFSDSFAFAEARTKKYGVLRQSGVIVASLEPLRHIQLDGSIKREYQVDSLQTEHLVQYSQAKLGYLHPRLPHGYVLVSQDKLPTRDRRKVQLNFNYDLQTMKSKMKLNALVRHILEEAPSDSTAGAFEWLCNAVFSLPFPLYGDFYYRHNNRYTNDVRKKNDSELRTSVNCDVIPGMYYHGFYRHELVTYHLQETQDMDLRLTFNNILHIAPGRWYAPLSIMNFSCGLSDNFDEYARDLSPTYETPYFFFKPIAYNNISSINRTQSYFASVYFTPVTELLVWAKHTNSKSGVAYYGLPDAEPTVRNEMKVEYEPGTIGRIIASFDHRTVKTYPHQDLLSIYTEWSKPWSAFLRTKFTILYRDDRKKHAIQDLESEEIRTNLQTLLRFGARSFITLYLGGYQNKVDTQETDYALTPGISANVNLLEFMYVQCDYESTLSSVYPAVHFISARLTAQF